MEAPLHCNTESPYTQLDYVLHFLFLVYFKKIILNIFIPPTFLNVPLHIDFDLPLCHGSLVAKRGGKTRAGGNDAAKVLQAV